MGWAKYFEDDMDLMFERQRALGERAYESVTGVMCTSTVPLTKLIVVVKNKTSKVDPATYVDKTITCRDCRNTFVFSAKAQKYYSEKQWSAPKRCKCCRAARKNTQSRVGNY